MKSLSSSERSESAGLAITAGAERASCSIVQLEREHLAEDLQRALDRAWR